MTSKCAGFISYSNDSRQERSGINEMVFVLFEEEGPYCLPMRDVGTKVYYIITVEVYQCSRWILDCVDSHTNCSVVCCHSSLSPAKQAA